MPKRLKPGRIPCIIPHCGRTANRDHYSDSPSLEIICQKHWSLSSKATRREYYRICRRIERYTPEQGDRYKLWKLWEQLKNEILDSNF